MNPSFVDHVRIYFQSGKGGNGVVSWRREKSVPKGGPDGGDGGRGGHIILKGNPQLWTLLDLRYRKYIKAEPGANGQGGRRTGKNGKDMILEVPLGTVVKDADSDTFIGEVTKANEKLIVLEGGHGGRGNATFKSSTNQAPDYATPGGEAKEQTLVLELKVLADVGLVGFPNAGKSTLLSVVTEAKPKIGAYPFTTLVPNLGIVRYKDYQSFVMADIPGIIEGAHQGKGLGISFLRHIERNSVLLFLVSVDADDIRTEYETLLEEVKLYNEELVKKPRMLVLSKRDLIDEELETEIRASVEDLNPVFISSAAQWGLNELKDRIWQLLQSEQT